MSFRPVGALLFLTGCGLVWDAGDFDKANQRSNFSDNHPPPPPNEVSPLGIRLGANLVVTLRREGSAKLTIPIERRDGSMSNSPIDVRLDGLPLGVSVNGPAESRTTTDSATFELAASNEAIFGTVNARVLANVVGRPAVEQVESRAAIVVDETKLDLTFGTQNGLALGTNVGDELVDMTIDAKGRSLLLVRHRLLPADSGANFLVLRDDESNGRYRQLPISTGLVGIDQESAKGLAVQRTTGAIFVLLSRELHVYTENGTQLRVVPFEAPLVNAYGIVQPVTDGQGRSFIVGASESEGGEEQLVLQRVTADGVYDPTYPLDAGVVTIEPAADPRVVSHPGFATLLAHWVATKHRSEGVVARLTVDGRLDSTFADGGSISTLDLGFTMPALVNGIAITANSLPVAQISLLLDDPDQLETFERNDNIFLRLDSNGRPDPTFGNAGVVHISPPLDVKPWGGRPPVIAGGKGRILIGSTTTAELPGPDGYNKTNGRVTAYDERTGTIDARFGNDPTAMGRFVSKDDSLREITFVFPSPKDDGTYLIAGAGGSGADSTWFVARLIP